MEGREDLKSILRYLPLVLRSSSLLWPSSVVEALKALSRGPDHSKVDSGELLSLAVSDLRHSLSLSHSFERLAVSTADGFSLFFDRLLCPAEAAKFFRDVLPAMANLLLRLPSLLEAHYQNADGLLSIGRERVKTGLRILESQESGIVFLSQELIGALLACSFFCLFPITDRGAKHLPTINFDQLFASLYDSYCETQENKIKCITHYFERICSSMPHGLVSFERKVLPLDHRPPAVSYPSAELWSKSCIPLCRFEIYKSGLMEDQSCEALEVDFANKYLGGGALNRGCVQEEIRFMISPELIVGMLFLPSMADNEAIEIVGAERFSHYSGYAASFRFSGDYIDKRVSETMGRRKMRIVAIDALCRPGKRQFGLEYLIREVNKAFCGFLDQSRSRQCQRLYQVDESSCNQIDQDVKYSEGVSTNSPLFFEAPTTSNSNGRQFGDQLIESCEGTRSDYVDNQDQIGIVTGNWGCGAFGGDLELKATIQWLAASQAERPFISYYTFGMEALQSLDQVTRWILTLEWTVGELWSMLVDYSSQRLKGETDLGFFTWLLPSLSPHPMMLDEPPQTP